MTTPIKALLALLVVFGAAVSPPAAAHGSVRFGIGIGVPLYPSPWYYPPPYYYPPAYYPSAPVVVQSQPVYVERSAAQAAPPPGTAPTDQFWYYCPDTKTYYPYVKQCGSPWQRVSPQPPPQ